MGEKHQFSVKKRTLLGKKTKQLRRQDLLVASISTPEGEGIAIEADLKSFLKLYSEVGESSLLYLKVEGENSERPVLIDEAQKDPLSEDLVHVTFRQVSLKEKVTAEVPLEFGEIEVKDAVVVTVRDSVEIEALPTDLPEKIVVDTSGLTEVGQSISLADLKFDKSKVQLVLGEDQNPEEMPVILIQEQKEEEPEEVAEEETAEGEAGEEKDGEKPQEDKASEADGGSKEEAKKED